MKKFLALFLLLAVCGVPAQAATYTVDPGHSSVTFKVKHLLSNVQGTFHKYVGTVDYEPGKSESWKTGGTIDVRTVDTNEPKRDKHLLSADFFDAEKFPTVDFRSTGVKDVTATGVKLEGLITMHGVEKPIVLDVTFNGVGKDPWGNTRASFSAAGKINRKDFGINWNQALDNGGVLVGEEVKIELEIEAIQKNP